MLFTRFVDGSRHVEHNSIQYFSEYCDNSMERDIRINMEGIEPCGHSPLRALASCTQAKTDEPALEIGAHSLLLATRTGTDWVEENP
jgi:hypothetical protein